MKLSGLLALSVATLALTGAALAQDENAYQNGPSEEVIVTAPYYSGSSGSVSGMPNHAKLSEEVRFDDLDLTTRHGAHELMERVRYTAREVCARLSAEVVSPQASDPSCYRNAVAGGMSEADSAIRDARGDTYNSSYEY